MKKGILVMFAAAAMVFTSCKENAADKVNEENVAAAAERDAQAGDFPVMEFSKTEHDFGTINEGDVVEHEFTFTNTGKAPLVVTNAKGSCGCTVTTWSKEPIAPGAEGKMLVKFNSNGKPNQQVKTVNITANTEAGKELIKIKAFVTPKKKAAGTPEAK